MERGVVVKRFSMHDLLGRRVCPVLLASCKSDEIGDRDRGLLLEELAGNPAHGRIHDHHGTVGRDSRRSSGLRRIGQIGGLGCGLLRGNALNERAATAIARTKLRAFITYFRVNDRPRPRPPLRNSLPCQVGCRDMVSTMRFSSLPLATGHLLFACALCLVATTSIGWPQPAPAADSKPAEKPAEKPTPDKDALPPLPPEKSAQQSMVLDGKTLHYTVTVGAYPTRDKDGKVAGEVVVTSYTMPGDNRPVTFAFNGGPGASSVYLNFGAIGPKHLQFGNEGDSPSDPTVLTDNPGHLAGFHRPGLHRSHRHRLQPRRGARGPAEEALLLHRSRHRVPLAYRLRLAGQKRPPRFAEISRRRELRRIPRAAHRL